MHKLSNPRLWAVMIGAGLLSACGGGGSDSAQHNVACASLPAEFRSSDPSVKISSATTVAASGAAPAYCDVRGTIKGNVKFAVYLPEKWNGRFQMVGNGGKAGSISLPDMASALKNGYATSSTDTGHDASIPAQSSARFGYDAEFGDEREIDFGYRAVNLTAKASKAIINAHYPKNIEYSYWNSCSTGGRQGLMEAQRYPEDFDGYVIGAPVNDYTRQQMSAPALLTHLYKNGIGGGSALSPAKRDLIGNIVYNGNGGNYPGCDALDGVKDGQIRNPLACNFNPALHVPACGATNGPNCLTSGELAAVQGVYAGRPANGIHPLPVGSETTAEGWAAWLVPNQGTPRLHSVMVDVFQYLLFQPDRPTFNYLTDFDWNADPGRMDKAKLTYNATDPDLRAFAARGKKIVMHHGWTDTGVNPMGTIEYKKRVDQASGGSAAVDSFLKLYMVPGMDHCTGGPGHTTIDWVQSVADWVERGTAPQRIIGSKAGSTRPHCPYPQEAVYDGSGNKDSASSYQCKAVN